MMRNNNGWVKFNRKMLDWEWIGTHKTAFVFMYCILRANWKDGKWMGVNIKRGSFATSIHNLARDVGMTEREVRTAIKNLTMTGSLTSKGYPKFTVITVINYDRYQVGDEVDDEQVTSKRRADDEQTTTIEEYKNKKKERINNSDPEPEEKPDGRVKVRYNDPEFAKQYPYADGWRADAEGYMYKLSAKEAKKARDERQRALSIQRR